MTPTKTILIVDDDEDFVRTASTILKGAYRIRTAFSGAQCLEAVTKEKPDLIIMDVMMNDVTDGLETAKKLKEQAATKNIPIIMLTSVNNYLDVHAQVDMAHYPRDRWFDKPVQPEKLLAAVNNLIGG